MTSSTSLPVCLSDYEELARQRLDAPVWAYLSGGAGDEHTLAWNRQAFQRFEILPRVLRSGTGGSTRIELLGATFAHPIFVAPVAYQRLFHADGEIATAHAAAAQDACMVLSTQSSLAMEEVAATARAPRWFQLYVQSTPRNTRALVDRAEAAGCQALVVTVDAPINGLRNREHRAGFRLPADVVPANLSGLPDPDVPPPSQAQSMVFDHFMRIAPSWNEVRDLIRSTRLPVLLKGITGVEDAELAISAGARGIIVSNHGGRTLDTLPATLDLLAEIAPAVAGRVPVLMDGGIRRGTDVFKAIALGANAVLVGRPVAYGLAVSGAFGVSHVLRLLRDELELAMALSGCLTIEEIVPSRIRRRI